MFSGIVEELGVVKNISRGGRNLNLFVQAQKTSPGTEIGESISVNGVCLTVVKNEAGVFSFDLVPETARSTNLGSLRTGEKVNLERSLKAGERICGHFVTGHVDCLGVIRRKSLVKDNLCFEISVAPQFLKYCLPKGSIAVDGISLTLAGKKQGSFLVYIIPHTLKNTTLGLKGPSDKVNVEFDILAKKL